MEPIVELRGLSKTFGSGAEQVAALQDVSVQVEAGEIFGIIGLSGAGKSTLVRCINLLERPDAGKVLFHGEDLMAMSTRRLRQVRRKISMIFQSFNLLEQRTALDNICFPLELEGVPRAKAKARARELLEIVGLPDKAGAYPVQLSGGQKQRIAIARALASNPEVLLCDEATSALDPQTTNSILNLLQTISRERKITVILITHQMSVIEQICNRVAILDSGVVAEIGEVERVFSNPQSAAGRRLVSPEVPLPLSKVIVGTKVGTIATIPPMVIAAFPLVARMVEGSLREVDQGVVEAAQSMGASPWQIVTKVMLPEALPSLISGCTITVATILGYGAMAGIIGGGGLGQIAINYGYYNFKFLVMWIAVIGLVVLVQIFQSLGTWLSVKCDKRLRNRK